MKAKISDFSILIQLLYHLRGFCKYIVTPQGGIFGLILIKINASGFSNYKKNSLHKILVKNLFNMKLVVC